MADSGYIRQKIQGYEEFIALTFYRMLNFEFTHPENTRPTRNRVPNHCPSRVTRWKTRPQKLLRIMYKL